MSKYDSLLPLVQISEEQYEEQKAHRLSRFEIIANVVIDFTIRTPNTPRSLPAFRRGLVYIDEVKQHSHETDISVVYKLQDHIPKMANFYVSRHNLVVVALPEFDEDFEIGYFNAAAVDADLDTFLESAYLESLLSA
jgi:hypothetical protein